MKFAAAFILAGALLLGGLSLGWTLGKNTPRPGDAMTTAYLDCGAYSLRPVGGNRYRAVIDFDLERPE